MSPLRRLATLALALSMAACSVGESLGPDGSIEARFTLRSLNGFSLPYTFSNGETLVSEELEMYRDGTYTVLSYYGSGLTREEDGYYTNTNGSIDFQPRRGDVSYQGSITNGVLTQIVNGFTQVYRRE